MTVRSSDGDQPQTAHTGTRFPQVPREPRLSDKVADLMRETIVANGLKPGDRLPSERELGEQFGVSRTVVREAVRALTAKGLIEVRSGSGLRVAAVDASTVAESMSHFLRGSELDYPRVHEVRAMLEVEMAGVAAVRRTNDDIRRLTEACESVEKAIQNTEAAAKNDLQFHREVAKATHNDLFLVLLDAIGGALLTVRREALNMPGAGTQTLTDHRNVLEAIVLGDSARAREAMQAHLANVEQIWQAAHREPTP